MENTVQYTLGNLSYGPNLIPNIMIFNLFLQTNNFPSLWKIGRITPIFKAGVKNLINNYRPFADVVKF